VASVRHPAAAVILGLAALSLLAPLTLLYDPWAWLVWGREITALELDTSGGPSWKPLTAIIATALAPTGDAAPHLWLWISRVGWLAAAALAWRLAAELVFADRVATGVAERFARRRVARARFAAGALAALGVVVLFDPFTSWARQFAGGLSEPLAVALVLGAVERGISRRPGQALALGLAAALLRPEAWPLLGLYGLWLWRAEPRWRGWLLAAAAGLPALWLAPDLLASGDALTGATRAREGTGSPVGEALEALGRALNLAPVALWAGAALAVASAWQARERAIPLLAAGALAWIAAVAALAAVGYAGLPRFAAPAAAIGCVLGGVGIVRALAAIDGMRASRRRAIAIAAASVLIAAFAVQAAIRAAEIPGELASAARYSESVDELRDLADDVGRQRAAACGPPSTTAFLSMTALAWQLDVTLGEVGVRTQSAPPRGTAFVDHDADPIVRAEVARAGDAIGERGRWRAYAVSCASASGAAIAGVVGAAR
jgi:hypothetical protein